MKSLYFYLSIISKIHTYAKILVVWLLNQLNFISPDLNMLNVLYIEFVDQVSLGYRRNIYIHVHMLAKVFSQFLFKTDWNK